MNSKEREGESLDAVAESLGISRDRWYKLRKIFTKAEEGDEEAQELLKAVSTGRPFPLRTTWENLGCCESPLPLRRSTGWSIKL